MGSPKMPDGPDFSSCPVAYIIMDGDSDDTIRHKQKIQQLIETKDLELSAKTASFATLFYSIPSPLGS